MTRRIVLIRHGESTFNEAFDVTGRDPNIVDAPLTEKGRQQALSIRDRVRRMDIELLLVSPLSRAIQTALLIASSSRQRIEVEPLCREGLFSSCDIGRAPAELALHFENLQFNHLAPDWWERFQDERLSIPETDRTFLSRIAVLRQSLIGRPEEILAIIGHASLFRRLCGRHLANCEITEIAL